MIARRFSSSQVDPQAYITRKLQEKAKQRNQRKRRAKWNVPYSKMAIPEAEKRLGFAMEDLRAIPVDKMLANAKHSLERDVILKIKEMVYGRVLEYLHIEGYPTEANPDFKEANVSDLVLFILSPIVNEFIYKTGRNVRIRREKEIVSTDEERGGTEEFVVMDRITVGKERFVIITEAKRASLGEAMKQCLLAMKDARDNNGGGVVHGLTTTEESWQMLSYDGTFSDDKQDGYTISHDGRRKTEMDKGLFLLGGLHIRSVKQWRHYGEIIENKYLVEFFPGGFVTNLSSGNTTISHGGPLERSERGDGASRSEAE